MPVGFGAGPAGALTQQEKPGLPFLGALQPHVRWRVVADLLFWAACASAQAGVFPTLFRTKGGTPIFLFMSQHPGVSGRLVAL